MNPIAKALRTLDACDAALDYVADYATTQDAWEACTRPNWLAWLIARLDQRQGALISCLCARSVAHLTGRYQAEIEALLGRIEAWAWGTAVDLAPVRQRLWAIYCAAYADAAPTDAVVYATTAATTVATTTAAVTRTGWTAKGIADAADNAAGCAAYDPIDFCNLIWAAVPTCPLAEAVLLELQFPSGTGEWIAEATYPLEEFIAKHRSGMWAAEIAGVRSLAVGESYWGGGGALPEWRVVRKG